MTKCTDKRGNELCTNGKDTYHEWNSRVGSCNFCWYSENNKFCECKRKCPECGKLIKSPND